MPIPQDVPVYRVLDPAGFYGSDDTLYPEGKAIVLEGPPNEMLEPLNDLARETMSAYLKGLDERWREHATRANLPESQRPKTLDEAIRVSLEGAKHVALTKGDTTGVPIMGARKRGRPRIRPLEEDAPVDDAPQTGRKSAPFGRLAVDA